MDNLNGSLPGMAPAGNLVKMPAQGEELSGIVTYIDVATPAGKLAVYNALQGQDAKLGEVLDLPLEIENFVAAPVTLVDQVTGEQKNVNRCVLLSPAGERFSCASDGILNSLRGLVAIFGPPPWRPALTLTAKQQNSRAGNRFYILELTMPNGQAKPSNRTPAQASGQ